MLYCHAVTGKRKVIVLVNEADIQSHRTRLAVIAVNALSADGFRRVLSDDGIIQIFFLLIVIGKQCSDFIRALRTRQHTQHSRSVQGVADALEWCQSRMERGSLRIQQLAAGERFHDGDADAFLLASSVYRKTLFILSVRVFPLTVVICRIDGEH